VVAQLAELPHSDIAAMAQYLASLTPARPAADATALAAASWQRVRADPGEAATLFQGACGACHHDGSGPAVFGADIALALNTNLHSARPDNLLRTILDGIATPARPSIGPMPGFRHSLDDRQLATLARFLRARFAPDQPAWTDLETTAARLRRLPL
jgi:nicotinate dehydrogenase subunit B